jgi:hypothetical protein
MKVPVDVITAEAGGKKTMLKLRDQTPDVDELELATGRTAQRIGHDQRANADVNSGRIWVPRRGV